MVEDEDDDDDDDDEDASYVDEEVCPSAKFPSGPPISDSKLTLPSAVNVGVPNVVDDAWL